ncbi:DUF2145 domain-containing protein [Hyphobacterium sp.]|uniref:DUF2145 domain-containing protein n=1 Tax=Hyphobacterium sp. TaxID=2004662 RepID=UPI0037492668
MRWLFLIIAVLGLSTPVLAGSNAAPSGRFTPQEAADFSKQIERDLAAQQARLAIVFRAGESRDELPDGVRYTHGAFWIYQPIETAGGTTEYGYAVYNLYHGEEDRLTSSLVQDWPIDFTLPDGNGQVGIIIPSPEMQRRLIALVASTDYAALHNPDYSLVSNPHDRRFQNCTEFMLDVIAAAAWQTTDIDRIKTNLRAHFRPAQIRLGLLTRIFGPMVDERFRTADHDGRIRTATWRTMADFMLENGLAANVYELSADHLSGDGTL